MNTSRPTGLAEWRRAAAMQSGGTSSGPIRALVIRLLQQSGAKGAVLDVGAGRGELLAELSSLGVFSRLDGMDLMPRPAGLEASIAWRQQDLNESFEGSGLYDFVICSETIEHLENPRQVLRNISSILRNGGTLVATMPNQESIRSFGSLVLAGHFVHFRDNCYPAHITALLREDVRRICRETGFTDPVFHYTDEGAFPWLTRFTWQRLSFGLARGRLFSDNIAFVCRKQSSP